MQIAQATLNVQPYTMNKWWYWVRRSFTRYSARPAGYIKSRCTAHTGRHPQRLITPLLYHLWIIGPERVWQDKKRE